MAMEQAGQSGAESSGQARVRFGVYNKPGAYAGRSVGDVRKDHAKLWGIPTDANAFKGSEKLDENYVIQSDDNIEFHRKAGEKGNR